MPKHPVVRVMEDYRVPEPTLLESDQIQLRRGAVVGPNRAL